MQQFERNLTLSQIDSPNNPIKLHNRFEHLVDIIEPSYDQSDLPDIINQHSSDKLISDIADEMTVATAKARMAAAASVKLNQQKKVVDDPPKRPTPVEDPIGSTISKA